MIGTYATASAKGTYASRLDAEPTQFIGLSHLSKYNAAVNEGSSFGRDYPYPFKYIFDDEGPVLLRVYLSEPAKGIESFTLTLGFPQPFWDPALDLTAEGFFEAQEGVDFTQEGGFSYKFKPGELYHEIRITPVLRSQWFVERILYITLEPQNCQGCTVMSFASINMVSIASRLTPPVLTVTAAASGTAAGFDVTFDLDAPCIDPVTVYYRWFDPGSGNEVIDVTPTDAANRSGTCTIPAGSDQKVVEFALNPLVPTPVDRKIEIFHERETVNPEKEQTWIDPETATYSVSRDIHWDENLVRRGSDVTRHGFTGFLTPKTYTAQHGFRPHAAGIPTMSLIDGASEINVNEPNPSQAIITIPTNPVNDPETGRPMYYLVPSDNVSGVPYVRQEFPPAYGGGPISAFTLLKWSRVSYRREFFTGSEAGKNVEYSRVGFRVRVRDRNHGVVFRFRNAGLFGDPWGDQTAASAAFQFHPSILPVAGDTIQMTDYLGATNTWTWVATATDPPTAFQMEVKATPEECAVEMAYAVASTGESPGVGIHRLTAVSEGRTCTVSQGKPRPVSSGDTAITCSSTAYLYLPPTRLVTSSISDAGGRDMRPVAVGGTNEQYYYDSTTGIEVWFYSIDNPWQNSAIHPPSGPLHIPTCLDAWGTWYGVTRDSTGLVLWYIHYMPRLSDTLDHWRYGTSDGTGNLGTGMDTDPPVGTGQKIHWNYNGWHSEGTGNLLLDDDVDPAHPYYNLRGYEFRGDVGNPIEYPVYMDARGDGTYPGPYQDGSRGGTNTLNSIRDNEMGCLWHSWAFETQDASMTLGPPTEYWNNAGNYWTPRGYAVTLGPIRSNHTINIT